PVAADGNGNQPFTVSGSAGSEGALSRSADGHFLTLAGYANVPGRTGIKSTTNLSTDASPVNRLVARIDAAGNIDTSTRLVDAFNTENVRGATSIDGTSF